MKDLTHIGMAQHEGKYGGGPKGDPFPVRLRGTKTRWYASEDGYGKWWQRESRDGDDRVCSGERSRSYSDTVLDLSTVRPMTVAELREPLATAAEEAQGWLNEAKEKVSEAETSLFEAAEPLAAFDKKHGWTGDDA